jgi:hypothetical protein
VCLAVARRARGKNISRSKQVTDWVAALPCGSGHTCTCNLVLVGMGADIPALAGAGGRRDGCAHGCCSRGSGGVAQTTAAMVLAKYGGNSGSGEAADLWSRRGWQRGQWVHGAVGWLRSPMLMPRGRAGVMRTPGRVEQAPTLGRVAVPGCGMTRALSHGIGGRPLPDGGYALRGGTQMLRVRRDADAARAGKGGASDVERRGCAVIALGSEECDLDDESDRAQMVADFLLQLSAHTKGRNKGRVGASEGCNINSNLGPAARRGGRACGVRRPRPYVRHPLDRTLHGPVRTRGEIRGLRPGLDSTCA